MEKQKSVEPFEFHLVVPCTPPIRHNTRNSPPARGTGAIHLIHGITDISHHRKEHLRPFPPRLLFALTGVG